MCRWSSLSFQMNANDDPPMKLPENHAERVERARLSLEGLAIGDAFGEMLACNCASARQRVDRGLMGGPWFHTDDTEMALAIFEALRSRGCIDPDDLALRFADRFRREPERGYGKMARIILRAILAGEHWQRAAAAAFSGTGSMGNGGAMRVAPLGAYFADDLETCLRSEAALSAAVTQEAALHHHSANRGESSRQWQCRHRTGHRALYVVVRGEASRRLPGGAGQHRDRRR